MGKTTIIWLGLVILTAISVVFSLISHDRIMVLAIVLAALKFVGVAFGFMELNKAHDFWKLSVLLFLLLFMTLIFLM